MADEKQGRAVPEYDAKAIEEKWQRIWEETDLYKTEEDPSKPKKYVLEMFPYPSGDLHMGHARNYTIGDAMARQARMAGFDVLHPIGFDAFGLPAENAAIKHKTQPGTWTYANMDNAVKTMKRMGFSYDYDRMVKTCDPDYYKWGQYIFLKMWEKGLVYRNDSPVNWCPECNTVLANEQVVDGKCWRCGSVPERRSLEQWYLKITDYAQELLDDLDQLPGWPERVKQMQRNWIGRSEGAEIDFALADVDGVTPTDTKITVFTTRPDTLFGATFFLLAPEHPMAHELVHGTPYEAEVEKVAAIAAATSSIDRQSTDREKNGAFTGRYMINPINGRPLPIWVSDYVLTDYGTGAVMGVPCGDERDFQFARKYGLDIPPIVMQKDDPLYPELKDEKDLVVMNVDWEHAMAAEGYLVQSGEFTGMKGGHDSEAVDAMIGWLEERGLGHKTVNFRLRDWLISRQRYWGNPIPAIHCPECGIVPVPEEDLPVLLPANLDLAKGETLAECPEFYETTCPVCGGPARRETDTMDTFTCSSWYYLRYCDPHNDQEPVSHAAADRWMPVDNYIGGIEHAILHLLYSRFWTKVMRDLGMISVDEPFTNLLCQGMVKDENGDTMSKSKGNVVPPSSVIDPYGADTMRLSILFIAPPEKDFDWDPQAVAGCNRFLKRAWRVIWELTYAAADGGVDTSEDAKKLERELHRLGMKVTDDYARMQYNIAIAGLMEIVNAASLYLHDTEGKVRDAKLADEVARDLVSMLSPITPHMCEELWHEALGEKGSAYDCTWPQFDASKSVSDTVEIAVQVSGKVRGHAVVPVDAATEEVEAAAKEAVASYLADKNVIKVIVIPNKLVNIVAK
jgi:leucyl-tRNA synthetase